MACDESNSVKYLMEEKGVLICKQCEAVFRQKIRENKNVFDAGERDEKLKDFARKVVSYRYSKLVANEYVKYLKSKTDMKFKTALDVGALYGIFVQELNRLGIDAKGIEADKHNVSLAVTDKIERDYFDENYKSDVKFDLICLTQMLYYATNPYAVLKHAKGMLTKDGLIFVATQNPSSTYIANLEVPDLIENAVNVFLSRKNFESLEDKIGLKLVDYTTFQSNIQLDRVLHVNEMSIFLKYRFKKAYEQSPNGHHAFVLLKPV
jgi:SAM-dependent methyltransferase